MEELKKILIVILTTLSWSTVVIASLIEPQELADIQYKIDQPQDIEYSKLITRMEFNLIHGNKYEFQENLKEIETLGIISALVNVYSTAVETEFANINPEFYQKALDIYPKELKLLKVLGRGHGAPGLTSDQLRWTWANYHYLVKDSSALRKMTGKYGEDDNDAIYVDGYIHLLLARLDNSRADAEEAINLLEQVMDRMDGSNEIGLRQGRLALHLGYAYLVLYSYEPKSSKNEALELASYYARMARGGLELHITPLLYGRALDLSADVLDEIILQKGPSKRLETTTIRLRYQRDSLRDLAIQYH